MTGTMPLGGFGYRGRLFSTRDMYDIDRTEKLFVAAVRENCGYHYRNCTEYRMILRFGIEPLALAAEKERAL